MSRGKRSRRRTEAGAPLLSPHAGAGAQEPQEEPEELAASETAPGPEETPAPAAPVPPTAPAAVVTGEETPAPETVEAAAPVETVTPVETGEPAREGSENGVRAGVLGGRARAVAGRGVRAPRRAGPLRRLYRGDTTFDFVGRRKVWIACSLVVIIAGLVSFGARGLNLGITFKGGEAWTVQSHGVTQTQAVNAVEAAGLSAPTVELLGTGSAQQIRVTADLNSLTAAQQHAITTKVIDALATLTKQPSTSVSVTTVGPTWGGEVTKKAVIALIVFFILIAIYISIRFEPKMAIAAFLALLHDLLVTAGVYSLAGLQVTPDTVIAVLTILGYSLYDTVVVFDRVRDNSHGLGASGKMTYTEMVNLSMNQTLARSVNTSLVAILPVISILAIGAELLGATTLQDFGLALCIGLISGAYSSIFIASPILAWLKEREPRYAAIRQRIESKGERFGLLTPKAAAAMLGGAGGSVRAMRAAADGQMLRPGRSRQGEVAPRAEAANPAPATSQPASPSRPAAKGRPASSGGRAPQAQRRGKRKRRH